MLLPWPPRACPGTATQVHRVVKGISTVFRILDGVNSADRVAGKLAFRLEFLTWSDADYRGAARQIARMHLIRPNSIGSPRVGCRFPWQSRHHLGQSALFWDCVRLAGRVVAGHTEWALSLQRKDFFLDRR